MCRGTIPCNDLSDKVFLRFPIQQSEFKASGNNQFKGEKNVTFFFIFLQIAMMRQSEIKMSSFFYLWCHIRLNMCQKERRVFSKNLVSDPSDPKCYFNLMLPGIWFDVFIHQADDIHVYDELMQVSCNSNVFFKSSCTLLNGSTFGVQLKRSHGSSSTPFRGAPEQIQPIDTYNKLTHTAKITAFKLASLPSHTRRSASQPHM